MARRDYFYDPEAPKPNSIRPAAAVALFDSSGNILLLRRKDNDKWTMPGGTHPAPAQPFLPRPSLTRFK